MWCKCSQLWGACKIYCKDHWTGCWIISHMSEDCHTCENAVWCFKSIHPSVSKNPETLSVALACIKLTLTHSWWCWWHPKHRAQADSSEWNQYWSYRPCRVYCQPCRSLRLWSGSPFPRDTSHCQWYARKWWHFCWRNGSLWWGVCKYHGRDLGIAPMGHTTPLPHSYNLIISIILKWQNTKDTTGPGHCW